MKKRVDSDSDSDSNPDSRFQVLITPLLIFIKYADSPCSHLGPSMSSWIRIRIRIQAAWIRIRIRIQENKDGFGFVWIRIRGVWIRIRIRIRDVRIRTSLPP